MIRKWMYSLGRLWQDVAFPQGEYCLTCGRRLPPLVAVSLCRRCFDRIPLVGNSFCTRCGRPVGDRAVSVCRRCQELSPIFFTVVRSLACYDGVVQEWLHSVKYRGQWELAVALGQLMALRYPQAGLEAVCVVPVPLHLDRLRQRGFNQAALLAEQIARYHGLPYYDKAVERTLSTRAQANLTPLERGKNLAGAFSVFEPAVVRGKTVLVVDDIFTTGSTINEMARVLLRAGAREVKGYCFAVSISDEDLEPSFGR